MTRILASVVVGINDGTFLEWYRRSSALDGRNLVKALRSVILGGLSPPPAAAAPAPTALKPAVPRRKSPA